MKLWRTALTSFLLFTLLFGFGYPLFIYSIGQLFFPFHAEGALLRKSDGTLIGSHWIAQDFQKPEYFHPRPSSAHYNGASSQGSNFGPTSQKLIDTLRLRALQYRRENNLAPDTPIPADAVTASGSGLDPHISLSNALLQAPRIALARNKSLQDIQQKISQIAEEPFLGIFGTQRVNVLLLNLALDVM